ncbi:MAG: type II toxin-antitoxin system VapC family toxin [Gemmataceae bacterium]|nr:type II toxin-antitoxin system VapC family toxin [Gemmataceae bacterium]
MNPLPLVCVVDASVAAQLYIPEPLTPIATILFHQLVTDPATTLHVPDLFFIECANIFWKCARRGGCSSAAATAAMANISALRLQRTPTFELTADAMPIAHGYDLTAYDACYVALAYRLGVALVTGDQRLVNKLAGSAYTVTWLGAWVPPAGTP